MEIIEGKNYLITGGTRGIGKATAKMLMEKGANAIILGTTKHNDTSDDIFTGNVTFYQYDLRDLDNIKKIFEFCRMKNLKLDGFVHCAGIAPLMPVEKNDINLMKDAFAINYFSFIEMMKFFQNPIYSNENASVVAMSSTTAKAGNYRQTIYASTKASIDSAVKSMAKVLLKRNIRINSVIAGCVATEMLDELKKHSDNLEDKIKQNQPLGIIPSEYIAKVICFLLSDDAKYITGTSMQVDGGSLL